MSTHINVGVNETRVCGAGRVCSIFIMLYPSFHADPTRPTPKRQGKGIFFNTKGTKESISNRENETGERGVDRIMAGQNHSINRRRRGMNGRGVFSTKPRARRNILDHRCGACSTAKLTPESATIQLPHERRSLTRFVIAKDAKNSRSIVFTGGSGGNGEEGSSGKAVLNRGRRGKRGGEGINRIMAGQDIIQTAESEHGRAQRNLRVLGPAAMNCLSTSVDHAPHKARAADKLARRLADLVNVAAIFGRRRFDQQFIPCPGFAEVIHFAGPDLVLAMEPGGIGIEQPAEVT